jgi:hypothetical protein
LIRSASATEVPPNFMTTVGLSGVREISPARGRSAVCALAGGTAAKGKA